MKKTLRFNIGDRVTVIGVPPEVDVGSEKRTARLFRRALGKTFRVAGFGEFGHLELVVAERRPSPDKYESDTIWIEPQFVTFAGKGRGKG